MSAAPRASSNAVFLMTIALIVVFVALVGTLLKYESDRQIREVWRAEVGDLYTATVVFKTFGGETWTREIVMDRGCYGMHVMGWLEDENARVLVTECNPLQD